jgi:hypothetical protein
MKTQLRKNFHSISLKCIFPNKSFVTMQMGYSDTGGRGQGVSQDAFNGVMAAFAKAHKNRFDKFASNGDFIDALNAKLESDSIANPIVLAQKIEEFAA